MKGTYYFLPTPGSPPDSFTTFDPVSKTWGTLDIDASAGISSMLTGASLAAVPAAVEGLDDYLVVSGGRSKSVIAYNTRTGTWTKQANMHNSQENSCSMECRGFWMSMTGDFKGIDDNLEAAKPANRQEYRYNLTSGEHFEVNGEKQRGGAGCACDPEANNGAGRAFWAGGYSNSAITDQIEMWQVDPNKRRGQPIFKMSKSRRDVGAAVCGGRFIVAGGSDGKSAWSTVDVFNSSSTADGERVTYDLGIALTSPRVTCLAERVALISGGRSGKTCNQKVFVLDTAALPDGGAALDSLPLPLSAVGQVAVAAEKTSGSVMFFDGGAADLFTLSESLVV